MRKAILIGLGLLLAGGTAVWAQQYVISTIAGGAPPPTPVAAVSASIGDVFGVATDATGNVYFTSLNCVFKVDKSGVLTRIAGNSRAGYSGDGGAAPISQLGINLHEGEDTVAVDSVGNLYIVDTGNGRIRKVSPSGIITTVAGGGMDVLTDGLPATNARLFLASGVAVDSAGNLYIADLLNNRIRKVSTTGIISTVAGNGTFSYSGDGGQATNAQLALTSFAPAGVAVDNGGNLYIADSPNYRIRKVSSGSVITTAAGNGTPGYSGDGGPASNAQVDKPGPPGNGPAGVAVDNVGNLYIADLANGRVRRVSTPDGIITTVAGGGTDGFGDGGPATNAQLAPSAVAVDGAGNLYISEIGLNNRIRKVSPNGIITTVAGNGSAGYSGDGGSAINAQLNFPFGVAVDSVGNLYIVDRQNNCIRKVSPSGIITTVAGRGMDLLAEGVPATSAALRPSGLAVDSVGNLYIADAGNNRIRKVSSNGIITTVAGSGAQAYSGDGGPAASAQLNSPMALAVDKAGNVYVADSGNNAIRLLQPQGPTLSISAVANAASNVPGPIAPGEIVVLYGSGIGPAQLTQFHLNDAGLVGTTLAGTQVLFNGTPAPLIYAWATQVAAIVPYEVSGTSAQVQVSYQGQTSNPITVPVAASAPGIFSLDSTGKGQAAAINHDNSINGASRPAPVGSIVSLYATGEG